MIRWWNGTFASFADVVSVPLMVFLSALLTILVALGWYFWPKWLPWNWKLRAGGGGGGGRRGRDRRRRLRLGRLRWRLRWRRKTKAAADANEDLDALAPDELPDMPSVVLALTADQLAEAGRFAEAVRERLRAIVRGLIERGLIPPSPGWTVTELARQAATLLPGLAAPLDGAVDVFSRIWYGLQPATAADDVAMRRHATTIAQVLAQSPTRSSA